jgi:hypothetical protein
VTLVKELRMKVAVTLLALALAGCGAPGLGERCNPLLFQVSDQCQANLLCVYPPHCGVAYCCPSGQTSDPNCQACPTDAGMDAGESD